MSKLKKIEVNAELEEILAGLMVGPSVKDEVWRFMSQLLEVGSITAGDRKQLREFAGLASRMEMTDQLIVANASDAKMFLRLSRERDAQAVLLRQLMRDMKVTRISAAPRTTESAAARKADQKSGSTWEGIL